MDLGIGACERQVRLALGMELKEGLALAHHPPRLRRRRGHSLTCPLPQCSASSRRTCFGSPSVITDETVRPRVWSGACHGVDRPRARRLSISFTGTMACASVSGPEHDVTWRETDHHRPRARAQVKATYAYPHLGRLSLSGAPPYYDLRWHGKFFYVT
jgi:hypothetical protein